MSRKIAPSFKVFFVAFFLIITAIPYFLHPSQDLPEPVNHDEAAFHINSKDIVLFGAASLKGDRLTGIVFPLQAFLGLISFSIFGISLASLRIPYILLNVIGNLLFFDLIRRRHNLFVAAVITAAFVFYSPRLIIGKAGMAESLTLPLILILLWCLAFVAQRDKFYFWIGALGILIFWTKLDNVFIPLFLTGFSILRSFASWRRQDGQKAGRIITNYFLGAASIILIWAAFVFIVGWREVLYYYSSLLRGNLDVLSLEPIRLFYKNTAEFYRSYVGFPAAAVIALLIFFPVMLFSKRQRADTLSAGIFMLLFLLVGKLLVSTAFYPRRIVPCYPLPFLLTAFITAPLVQNQGLKKRMLIFAKYGSLFVILPALVYICYLPSMLTQTYSIVFSPAYTVMREARRIYSILDKRYKVIFLDGRFSYIAIQLPVKFIDIPPDLNEREDYLADTNPSFTRKRIYEEPDIGYIIFRADNGIIKNMVEEEFSGKLIAGGIRGSGLLYRLPPRRDLWQTENK